MLSNAVFTAGPEVVSDVWPRNKDFGSRTKRNRQGVQQDDPICPVGGNVPQLPLLSERIPE